MPTFTKRLLYIFIKKPGLVCLFGTAYNLRDLSPSCRIGGSSSSCPSTGTLLHILYKKNPDPTSKKNSSRLKKKEKNNTVSFNRDPDLHWNKKDGSKSDIKNTVPDLKKQEQKQKQQYSINKFTSSNYFSKRCTPIDSFSMLLRLKLFHSFKITIKCTKWIYLHV